MTEPKQLNGTVSQAAIDTRAVLKEIAAIRKLAGDLGDRAARLEEHVAQGQTSTRALVVEFRAAWERKTGDVYVGTDVGDNTTIRRLLKKLPAEALRIRMARYFAGRGDAAFAARNGWSLGIFAQQINALGGAAIASTESATTSRARSVADDLEAGGMFK